MSDLQPIPQLQIWLAKSCYFQCHQNQFFSFQCDTLLQKLSLHIQLSLIISKFVESLFSTDINWKDNICSLTKTSSAKLGMLCRFHKHSLPHLSYWFYSRVLFPLVWNTGLMYGRAQPKQHSKIVNCYLSIQHLLLYRYSPVSSSLPQCCVTLSVLL